MIAPLSERRRTPAWTPARSAQRTFEAIDRLESEGDQVYREALGRLFDGVYDALDVLRWKDIVEAIEESVNGLEKIGDIVEGIALKHN